MKRFLCLLILQGGAEIDGLLSLLMRELSLATLDLAESRTQALRSEGVFSFSP